MNAVISVEETCLLSTRQASFRRHELYPGSITELGNLHCNAKGSTIERLIRKGIIKRVSTGVFYKPKQTAFGELRLFAFTLKPGYNWHKRT